jgi:hypothetical protein
LLIFDARIIARPMPRSIESHIHMILLCFLDEQWQRLTYSRGTGKLERQDISASSALTKRKERNGKESNEIKWLE